MAGRTARRRIMHIDVSAPGEGETRLAHRPGVPELGEDRAALGVHGVGDLPPAGQGLLAEEPRHPGAAARPLVHVSALGDQQAERRRPARVVRGDVRAGGQMRHRGRAGARAKGQCAELTATRGATL